MLETRFKFPYFTVLREHHLQSTDNNISRPTVKFPAFEYIALLTPVVLLVLVVGFSIVYYRTESQIRSLIDEDNIRVNQISGFIGAYIGIFIARELGLPEFFAMQIGGQAFPIVWSVVGATIFTLVIGLMGRGLRRR